ncbi:caspase family protein [Desulfobacter curvatus]|uniref:caspase family protein n=1 Tax=Desulfobacter curvatus TaxID=2290 RepID=UPI00146B4267|nr:caspase family protein [Desulfobacter curvatus]
MDKMKKDNIPMVTKRIPEHILAVFWVWIIVFSLTAGTGSAAQNDQGIKRINTRRVALVIGNSNYDVSPLSNPVNDADDMETVLKKLKFTVIKGTNLDKRGMLNHLSRFSTALRQADVGLFFFGGHGIQFNNRNYLIPVGCTVKDETDVEFEGLDARRVIFKMESAGSRLNIVILDACRNNPFHHSFRSAAQGLARMDAPKGTIIAYATSPGSVASDGTGRNGTFTRHLLSAFTVLGLNIQDIFNQAGMGVMEETGDKQIPGVSNTPIPRYFLAGWPEDGDNIPSKKGSITVKPSPPDSRVRILNIPPKYKDGIKLKPGRYHIEVSAEGYPRQRHWVPLKAGQDLVLNIDLVEESGPKPVPRSSQGTPVISSSNNNKPIRPRSPSPGDTWTEPVTGMMFVWVPEGCFRMGSNSGNNDEKPVHQVCLDGFWMGKTKVTQGQWKKIMGNNPSYFKSGNSHPVEQISCYDTKIFLSKLNAQTGQDFKLPSEAQWEYAARSGGKEETYAGGNHFNQLAWYRGNSGDQTHSVATKSSNGLGLYDMSGNVWEWCEDVHDENAYSKHAPKNPLVSSSVTPRASRVIRGGS